MSLKTSLVHVFPKLHPKPYYYLYKYSLYSCRDPLVIKTLLCVFMISVLPAQVEYWHLLPGSRLTGTGNFRINTLCIAGWTCFLSTRKRLFCTTIWRQANNLTATDLLQVVPTRPIIYTPISCFELVVINLLSTCYQLVTCRQYQTCWNNLLRVCRPHQPYYKMITTCSRLVNNWEQAVRRHLVESFTEEGISLAPKWQNVTKQRFY
jgi:hypothetical protein